MPVPSRTEGENAECQRRQLNRVFFEPVDKSLHIKVTSDGRQAQWKSNRERRERGKKSSRHHARTEKSYLKSYMRRRRLFPISTVPLIFNILGFV